MPARVALFIGTLLVFIFGPWWLGLVLVCLGIFLFDFYLEGIGLVFFWELLSSGVSTILPGYFVLTAISLVFWSVVAYIKPRLLY